MPRADPAHDLASPGRRTDQIADQMRFKKYEERNLEDVIRIFRSNIPKYFSPGEEPELRAFLSEFSDGYYVAEINGEIVGSGGFEANSDGKTVSLCWGMIRDDHLGTGLGRKLTIFRIEKARESFGPLPLVISTSQHTKGFYEKLGFSLTDHTPDGFGPGIDICKMRKDP